MVLWRFLGFATTTAASGSNAAAEKKPPSSGMFGNGLPVADAAALPLGVGLGLELLLEFAEIDGEPMPEPPPPPGVPDIGVVLDELALVVAARVDEAVELGTATWTCTATWSNTIVGAGFCFVLRWTDHPETGGRVSSLRFVMK